MERITIKVEVPRKVALLAAIPEFGENTYQPSSDALEELTTEEREWLDSKLGTRFYLETPTVTWPAVLDAIRKAHKAELDTRERRITEALTRPSDDWFLCDYGYPRLRAPYPACEYTDDRLVARLEELRPELERRQAEHEAKKARQKAEDDERKAQQEAEQSAVRAKSDRAAECIRAWAEAQEDDEALSRAATDDYDVTNKVLEILATELAESLNGEVDHEGSSRWSRWDFEERSAPSAEAFQAYDEAKETIATLAKPPCVDVTLERICRVTESVKSSDEYEPDSTEFYTAIVILIDCPVMGSREWAVIVKVDES